MLKTHPIPAEPRRRLNMMPTTMIPVPITDTAQMRRLTAFAADVAQLADQRPDLDLRELIDGLFADLLLLRGDDDG